MIIQLLAILILGTISLGDDRPQVIVNPNQPKPNFSVDPHPDPDEHESTTHHSEEDTINRGPSTTLPPWAQPTAMVVITKPTKPAPTAFVLNGTTRAIEDSTKKPQDSSTQGPVTKITQLTDHGSTKSSATVKDSDLTKFPFTVPTAVVIIETTTKYSATGHTGSTPVSGRSSAISETTPSGNSDGTKYTTPSSKTTGSTKYYTGSTGRGPSTEFTSTRRGPSTEYTTTRPGEFTTTGSGSSTELTSTESGLSTEFTFTRRAEVTPTGRGSPTEFTTTRRAEFTPTRRGPSTEFTSTTPGPSTQSKTRDPRLISTTEHPTTMRRSSTEQYRSSDTTKSKNEEVTGTVSTTPSTTGNRTWTQMPKWCWWDNHGNLVCKRRCGRKKVRGPHGYDPNDQGGIKWSPEDKQRHKPKKNHKPSKEKDHKTKTKTDKRKDKKDTKPAHRNKCGTDFWDQFICICKRVLNFLKITDFDLGDDDESHSD